MVLLIVAALAVVSGRSQAQSFADGLQAYDGGDTRASAEIWRGLSEAGNAEAQAALAMLHSGGEGVPFDMRRAAALYERTAKQGNVDAQLNLGDFYARGAGVRRDLTAAHMWLGLAAAQGRTWAEARRRAIARRMSVEAVAEAERRARAWRPIKETP
jgi:TPR repeat protein